MEQAKPNETGKQRELKAHDPDVVYCFEYLVNDHIKITQTALNAFNVIDPVDHVQACEPEQQIKAFLRQSQFYQYERQGRWGMLHVETGLYFIVIFEDCQIHAGNLSRNSNEMFLLDEEKKYATVTVITCQKR